jgi:molybdopterin-guanine dinucleotide biosynthesis protein A
MDKKRFPSFNKDSFIGEDLSIAIQAGGKSTRMGSNKSKIAFLGKPLILRVLERIQDLSSETIILSNTNDLDYKELKNIPIYSDIIPEIGPLGGLYTSLKLATKEFVALVACDMPFVSQQLIHLEYEIIFDLGCDVVIPETDQGYEPMHAIYRRSSCLPKIEEALAKDERRMISWFPGMNIHVLSNEVLKRIDPHLHMFFNINTLDDLHLAEEIAMKLNRND